MPCGTRIIINKIVNYWVEDVEGEDCVFAVKTETVHGSGCIARYECETTEERDAVLSRLDNYFQEIP